MIAPAKYAVRRWIVRIVDTDPQFGGITEVVRYGTRLEAVWYGEHEVAAAKELGFAPVTFTVHAE